jgi:AcrR family transcriptional regulator
MSMTRQSYHHGDLRSAVLEEALSQLETGSLEDLSLREVARNVGVSATAVYRHFPSKDDLLKALALHGLALLGEQQRKAAAKAGGTEAFAQTGRAYVRFALKHPNLFRLIFIHSPGHMKPTSRSPEGSPARLLWTNVADALGPHASQEKIFAVVLRSWSLVHGLAMLILDGQVERKAAEALIDQVIISNAR